MKKTVILLFLPAAILFLCECSKKTDANGPAYSAVPQLPSATASYYPDNHSKLNEEATLGRVLFYDAHLSLNNTVSCGSCHQQQYSFGDNVALSKGFDGRPTKRNSLPILDLPQANGFLDTFPGSTALFWDGRENNIKNLILRPVSNHVEMGMTDLSQLPGKLSALPYYPNLFKEAYGDETITLDRISTSISAFISAIQTPQQPLSPTDPLAQKGFNLFIGKYDCEGCHQTIFPGGYSLSDFMNNGLDKSYSDSGRAELTSNPRDEGVFKAPKLHNIALTAPYMHDGRFKTLDEVLDFYSDGVQNNPNLSALLRDSSGLPLRMNIPEEDRKALKAFLLSLTDYTIVTDPKFSDPFRKN